ncbi:MAG: hypothetical protein ACLU8D_01095 [Enterocloster sp.]
MTIEHKLQHFEELCIHSAQEAGEKMTADYTAYLESVLRDHEENVRKQAEARLQTETETIQREANKRLAINQIGLKRTYSQKQEELQGRIFSELRDRLARFMETPAYETLLKEQIRKARFCPGREIHIYIDPVTGKQNLIHGNRLRHPCEPYPFSAAPGL